ncbi:MAG: hypothetical protein IH602_19445 [Bryobacteraceae bacterium]|nr:hypothetical protein [Bryobacteraceae bacterium]
MSLITAAATVLLTAIPAATAQPPPVTMELFEEAARNNVKRLPPSAFKELPPNVLAELNRRRCTIPQPHGVPGLRNVIKGAFAKPGQTDWVVLCSVNLATSLLVFWDGADKPEQIGQSSRDIYFMSTGPKHIPIYERALAVVGREYIMEHYRQYGGPKPPPIDHDGIDDGHMGKASVVYYFYQGKWLRLQGAD